MSYQMVVALIYSAVAISIILWNDYRHEKNIKAYKKRNEEVVTKHNDLVTKYNSLRLTNKTYTDMIIERNAEIIRLNEKIHALETGKQKTGVLRRYDNIFPLSADRDKK